MHVARLEESKRAFKILIDKPKGNGPLGRPGSGLEISIRIYLEEIHLSTNNLIDSLRIGRIGESL